MIQIYLIFFFCGVEMGCLIELLCVLQVECGSFGLLILTFFLSFVFLYFWSEAQNDYNDFDWFVLSTLTNTDKCSHINVLPLAHMSGEETFTLYFPTDWQMVAEGCWLLLGEISPKQGSGPKTFAMSLVARRLSLLPIVCIKNTDDMSANTQVVEKMQTSN